MARLHAIGAPLFLCVALSAGAGGPLVIGAGGPVAPADDGAAETRATPSGYENCGPDAIPETGLQGQVPKRDQDSGAAKRGYRCNVRLIGSNDIQGRGANFQLAWYRDCAYVGIVGNQAFQMQSEPAADPLDGVAVLDATDPRAPRLVEVVRSDVGRSQHEAIEVNEKRGMLVVQIGGLAANWVEFYDVSKDCRHPVFKGRYTEPTAGLHGLRIAADGLHVYLSDSTGQSSPGTPVSVLDASDMTRPRLIARWGAPPAVHGVHDLEVSADGRRAYVGVQNFTNATGGLVAGGPSNNAVSMVVLDTSEVQDGRPDPELKEISGIQLTNFGHTEQLMRVRGTQYLISSGEAPIVGLVGDIPCPWAWGHILDISNEARPREVSQLKLEVNERSNCDELADDRGVYSIHYVGVDDPENTTKVFFTYYTGGLRVFDVRDPAHPKEIAYYHPRPIPSTKFDLGPLGVLGGGEFDTPTLDAATSVVRYRPETGQLWFASVAAGFQIAELTGDYACVPASAAARGLKLGVASLHRTRMRQAAALPARPRADGTRTRPGMDRFCTTDAHTLRIGYPTARLLRGLDAAERGRISGGAIAVRSDSPYASVRGIAPGTSVTDLRRRLRPADTLRIGRDTWYLARGRARAIFRTRGGVVREVGIADARLTSTPRSARRLLRSWRASVAR